MAWSYGSTETYQHPAQQQDQTWMRKINDTLSIIMEAVLILWPLKKL